MNLTKNLLLVYYPDAGKGQFKNNLHAVVDTFTKAGYLTTLYPTQKARDVYQIIQAYGTCPEGRDPESFRFPFDLLVISGGDGTLHECINAVMELPEKMHIPLGYIPAGSTNDFAVSHTIPKEPIAAAEAIVSGSPEPFDIGLFGSTYFSYVAAFGSFTDVTYDTPQEVKNIWGHLAYVIEGAKRFPSYKPHHMIVEADGEKIEGDFLLGMVANTTSVGGFAIKHDEISLQDGLSDLILIRYSNDALQNLATLNAVLTQDFSSPGLVYRKVKRTRFLSQEYIAWTLDGEYGGEYTDISTDTCQAALSFMCADKK
ncbi:MAG: YegS/Rv2252/BmrU family lipid kinase [Firmicutes bacterium]|nr:YegS/Rv2252/BmrU family lipid kinase [Bacillota bacterium]